MGLRTHSQSTLPNLEDIFEDLVWPSPFKYSNNALAHDPDQHISVSQIAVAIPLKDNGHTEDTSHRNFEDIFEGLVWPSPLKHSNNELAHHPDQHISVSPIDVPITLNHNGDAEDTSRNFEAIFESLIWPSPLKHSNNELALHPDQDLSVSPIDVPITLNHNGDAEDTSHRNFQDMVEGLVWPSPLEYSNNELAHNPDQSISESQLDIPLTLNRNGQAEDTFYHNLEDIFENLVWPSPLKYSNNERIRDQSISNSQLEIPINLNPHVNVEDIFHGIVWPSPLKFPNNEEPNYNDANACVSMPNFPENIEGFTCSSSLAPTKLSISNDSLSNKSYSEFALDDVVEGLYNLSILQSPILPEGETLNFDSISLVSADPKKWALAWSEIHTLSPKEYLGGALLEYYILNHIISVGEEAPIHYIPFDIINEITFRINRNHIPYEPIDRDIFFQTCGYKPWQENNLKPLCFIVLQSNHYFTVVFDPLQIAVYVFGRISYNGQLQSSPTPSEVAQSTKIWQGSDDWEKWNGPAYWFAIHELFGWNCPKLSHLNVINFMWLTNGYDCGPEACFILDYLFKLQRYPITLSGFSEFPNKPCGHFLRLEILQRIFPSLNQSHAIWHKVNRTRQKPLFWVVPEDVNLDESILRFTNDAFVTESQQNLERMLTQVGNHCQRCLSKSRELSVELHINPVQQKLEEISGDAHVDSEPESIYEVTFDKDPIYHPLITANSSGPLRAIARRKRHVFAPIIPKQRFQPLPFDDDFDQYNQGPTIQEKLGIPLYLLNHPSNPFGQKEHLSDWTLFCDYGFRLDRSFALAFNSDKPYEPLQHFLPISNSTGYEQIFQEITDYSLSRRSTNRKYHHKVNVDDIVKMGLAEMLEESGDVGSDAGFGLFIQGKHWDGRFVAVDVERDTVIPDDIHISIDIDSLIWVTHNLHFKLAIKIHTLPYVRDRPPIGVHNHMSVNILLPQTDIQRDNNQYTLPQRFKLSSIPHTHFAQLGEGSGSTNVYVFFPRMIHKQTNTPFWATSIPVVVQNLWFSKVIHPCLLKVAGLGREEYMNFTLREWHERGTSSVPFTVNQLKQFQALIREVILEDEDLDDLTIFGSFFFVVDCRGIKLWTKDGTGDYDDIIQALQTEFPQLDLDYMGNRENGQCVLDLGVSFTPIHPVPLVGLWNIPHVDASYAQSGSNVPKIHSAGTMAYYGSLQAEYPRDRSAATHLVFRSTYNLYFESVRKAIWFCEDRDAYEANSKFKACIRHYVENYEEARGRSYGVREEIRGSIMAVKIILKDVKQKAYSYSRSPAIAWVPSKLWFEFWIRRIRELEKYLLWLVQNPPLNLGILTTILMYMFRTIFTTERVDSLVKGFLYDVHLREISERFGLFFLHTLDRRKPYIPELPATDPEDLLRLIAPKKRRKAKILQPVGNPPSLQFPLGDRPNWNLLSEAISKRPDEMLNPSTISRLLGQSYVAEAVFIRFTRDYWLTLHEQFIVGDFPNPQTVEEAVQTWTVDNLIDSLTNVTFAAVKAIWPGLPKGRLESSFEERFDVFFPSPDHVCHVKSNWQSMWDHGYIAFYHTRLQRMSNLHKIPFQLVLKQLLDSIQCLPYAVKCSPKNPGRLWIHNDTKDGVKMLTNPKLYKIRGINNDNDIRTKVKPVRFMASKNLVEARIQANAKGIPVAEELRRRLQTKRNQSRSQKNKNARNPPLNRHITAKQNIPAMINLKRPPGFGELSAESESEVLDPSLSDFSN